MDTDTDGWITPKEFKQYHQKTFQAILAIFDLDRDNQISEDDFVSHNQKKFTLMDRDSDGSLDLAEINASLTTLATNPRAKGAAYWQYCYKPENPEFCISHPKLAPPLVSGPGNSWGGVWPSNPDNDNIPPDNDCPVEDIFNECYMP